jgi:hypothetical protein
VESAAYQIRFLLSYPEIAAKLGESGHEHVKENFSNTHKLKRYLTLFLAMAGGELEFSVEISISVAVLSALSQG